MIHENTLDERLIAEKLITKITVFLSLDSFNLTYVIDGEKLSDIYRAERGPVILFLVEFGIPLSIKVIN